MLNKATLKTEPLTKNTAYVILLCLLTIGVINYDVFVLNQLWLGDSFLLTLLFLLYAAVHVITSFNENNIIRVLIKLTLLMVTFAGFFHLLLLLSVVYAFTGQKISVIFCMAVLCNTVLFMTVFMPLAKGIAKQRRYRN